MIILHRADAEEVACAKDRGTSNCTHDNPSQYSLYVCFLLTQSARSINSSNILRR
jgi:hypothetical protein